MNTRARTGSVCAGVFLCLLAWSAALAQMEVQIGPGPVDPNATPNSPLNPRRSLLRPQPVEPETVRPDMRIPATPHPEALRPGRSVFPPGYTLTRTRDAQGDQRPIAGPLERPGQISDALMRCWRPPPAGFRQEITIRVAFRKDGDLMGEPRITWIGPTGNVEQRAALRNSMLRAISLCVPMRFTPAMASAIAGRPFAMRFIAPAQ